MPSTGSQSTPVENQPGWSQRYGLPSWMRNNIDRLNMSTNFEEYACSPPETDSGFLPEFETKLLSPPMEERPKLPLTASVLKTSKSAPTLCDLERSAQQRELSKALKEATRQSFLANSASLAVPHILGTNSASTSTETTPTSTPQGSPFNIRKAMRKEDFTAAGNNGKRFYTGVLSEKGAETMPIFKENPDSAAPALQAKRDCPVKIPLTAKGYKKYTLSNFDLNAVSPTSW